MTHSREQEPTFKIFMILMAKNSDSEETATIMTQKLHEPIQTQPATSVPVIYS
jgi:hypothetical protein